MDSTAFLQADTIIMIFVFVCFVVMTFLFLRATQEMDDLKKIFKRERNDISDELVAVKKQLEEFIRFQAETATTLRGLSGKDHRVDPSARDAASPDAGPVGPAGAEEPDSEIDFSGLDMDEDAPSLSVGPDDKYSIAPVGIETRRARRHEGAGEEADVEEDLPPAPGVEQAKEAAARSRAEIDPDADDVDDAEFWEEADKTLSQLGEELFDEEHDVLGSHEDSDELVEDVSMADLEGDLEGGRDVDESLDLGDDAETDLRASQRGLDSLDDLDDLDEPETPAQRAMRERALEEAAASADEQPEDHEPALGEDDSLSEDEDFDLSGIGAVSDDTEQAGDGGYLDGVLYDEGRESGEVTDLGGIEELEAVDDLEPSDDLEELEGAAAADGDEDLDGMDDLDDLEPVDDLEELDGAVGGDGMEGLADLDDLDDTIALDEVDGLADLDEAPDLDDVGDLSDLDDLDDPGDLSDLDDIAVEVDTLPDSPDEDDLSGEGLDDGGPILGGPGMDSLAEDSLDKEDLDPDDLDKLDFSDLDAGEEMATLDLSGHPADRPKPAAPVFEDELEDEDSDEPAVSAAGSPLGGLDMKDLDMGELEIDDQGAEELELDALDEGVDDFDSAGPDDLPLPFEERPSRSVSRSEALEETMVMEEWDQSEAPGADEEEVLDDLDSLDDLDDDGSLDHLESLDELDGPDPVVSQPMRAESLDTELLEDLDEEPGQGGLDDLDGLDELEELDGLDVPDSGDDTSPPVLMEDMDSLDDEELELTEDDLLDDDIADLPEMVEEPEEAPVSFAAAGHDDFENQALRAGMGMEETLVSEDGEQGEVQFADQEDEDQMVLDALAFMGKDKSAQDKYPLPFEDDAELMIDEDDTLSGKISFGTGSVITPKASEAEPVAEDDVEWGDEDDAPADDSISLVDEDGDTAADDYAAGPEDDTVQIPPPDIHLRETIVVDNPQALGLGAMPRDADIADGPSETLDLEAGMEAEDDDDILAELSDEDFDVEGIELELEADDDTGLVEDGVIDGPSDDGADDPDLIFPGEEERLFSSMRLKQPRPKGDIDSDLPPEPQATLGDSQDLDLGDFDDDLAGDLDDGPALDADFEELDEPVELAVDDDKPFSDLETLGPEAGDMELADLEMDGLDDGDLPDETFEGEDFTDHDLSEDELLDELDDGLDSYPDDGLAGGPDSFSTDGSEEEPLDLDLMDDTGGEEPDEDLALGDEALDEVALDDEALYDDDEGDEEMHDLDVMEDDPRTVRDMEDDGGEDDAYAATMADTGSLDGLLLDGDIVLDDDDDDDDLPGMGTARPEPESEGDGQSGEPSLPTADDFLKFELEDLDKSKKESRSSGGDNIMDFILED